MTNPTIAAGTVFPDPTLSASVAVVSRVVDSIFNYDVMRAGTYARRPGNPNRIAMRTFGSATALRFPAVGYFNQVYQFREADLAVLPEIVAYYREAGLGLKLNVAADTRREAVFESLAQSGFHVKETLARMVRPIEGNEALPSEPHGIRFTAVAPDERAMFFEMYLESFGADPAKRAEALENMTRLFDVPELTFRFARNGDVPVGLCMLHRCGRTALLCAGATLPEWRCLGIQRALIDLRLRMSREAGCDLAVSWTDAGSQSQENLMAAGFETAVIDPVWFLGPNDPWQC